MFLSFSSVIILTLLFINLNDHIIHATTITQHHTNNVEHVQGPQTSTPTPTPIPTPSPTPTSKPTSTPTATPTLPSNDTNPQSEWPPSFSTLSHNDQALIVFIPILILLIACSLFLLMYKCLSRLTSTCVTFHTRVTMEQTTSYGKVLWYVWLGEACLLIIALGLDAYVEHYPQAGKLFGITIDDKKKIETYHIFTTPHWSQYVVLETHFRAWCLSYWFYCIYAPMSGVAIIAAIIHIFFFTLRHRGASVFPLPLMYAHMIAMLSCLTSMVCWIVIDHQLDNNLLGYVPIVFNEWIPPSQFPWWYKTMKAPSYTILIVCACVTCATMAIAIWIRSHQLRYAAAVDTVAQLASVNRNMASLRVINAADAAGVPRPSYRRFHDRV